MTCFTRSKFAGAVITSSELVSLSATTVTWPVRSLAVRCAPEETDDEPPNPPNPLKPPKPLEDRPEPKLLEPNPPLDPNPPELRPPNPLDEPTLPLGQSPA